MMRLATALIVSLSLAGTLTGCGIFGDEESADLIEENPASAPTTKDLVKGLPHDMRGDTENARHTNQPLRGDDDTGDSE